MSRSGTRTDDARTLNTDVGAGPSAAASRCWNCAGRIASRWWNCAGRIASPCWNRAGRIAPCAPLMSRHAGTARRGLLPSDCPPCCECLHVSPGALAGTLAHSEFRSPARRFCPRRKAGRPSRAVTRPAVASRCSGAEVRRCTNSCGNRPKYSRTYRADCSIPPGSRPHHRTRPSRKPAVLARWAQPAINPTPRATLVAESTCVTLTVIIYQYN